VSKQSLSGTRKKNQELEMQQIPYIELIKKSKIHTKCRLEWEIHLNKTSKIPHFNFELNNLLSIYIYFSVIFYNIKRSYSINFNLVIQYYPITMIQSPMKPKLI